MYTKEVSLIVPAFEVYNMLVISLFLTVIIKKSHKYMVRQKMRIYHTCPRNRKIGMHKGYGGKKKLFLRVKTKYRPDFTVVHTVLVNKLNKDYKINKAITRVMLIFLTQI